MKKERSLSVAFFLWVKGKNGSMSGMVLPRNKCGQNIAHALLGQNMVISLIGYIHFVSYIRFASYLQLRCVIFFATQRVVEE